MFAKLLILWAQCDLFFCASKFRKFTYSTSGRPPLEDTCHDLHKTIVDVATAGAGANSLKRTECL